MHYEIGGILMLAGTFRAGDLVSLELIDALTAEHGMSVSGGNCISYIRLISEAVSAVLRLSVNDISGYAICGSLLD